MQSRIERDGIKTTIDWEREAAILQKMNTLQQEHIVRFITAFRRGERGSERHYLMFEWADGGNLRNLWRTYNRQQLTPGLVQSAVKQLEGLATALHKAHYPGTSTSFRHGDLKPENILWFKPDARADQDDIGILKIADWGLAREQLIVTVLRSTKTVTLYGTRRYEPPEEETRLGVGLTVPGQNQQGKQPKRRSRLYDIWAMGCIALEFLIWLMYGPEELRRFNDSFRTGISEHSEPFYEVLELENGRTVAQVHRVATAWMNHMAQDPICAPGATALGNLLDIVQNNLLVVRLPERLATFDSAETPMALGRRRADSAASVSSLASSISELPTQAGTGAEPLPSIVVSKEESSGVSQLGPPEREPVLLSKSAGPERARAMDLVRFLNEMIVDHEEESYWLAGEPGDAPPHHGGSPVFPRIIEPSNQYQTEVEDSVPLSTLTLVSPSQPKITGSLRPPEPTRVSFSTALCPEFCTDGPRNCSRLYVYR